MAQEDIRGKDLPNIATAFADDDIIIVDGDNKGTRRMPKNTLLQLTSQNALAGNVAPAFDPTRTSENPYKAGESIAYDGKTYTFKVDHYGAWSSADVYATNSDALFARKNLVGINAAFSEFTLSQGAVTNSDGSLDASPGVVNLRVSNGGNPVSVHGAKYISYDIPSTYNLIVKEFASSGSVAHVSNSLKGKGVYKLTVSNRLYIQFSKDSGNITIADVNANCSVAVHSNVDYALEESIKNDASIGQSYSIANIVLWNKTVNDDGTASDMSIRVSNAGYPLDVTGSLSIRLFVGTGYKCALRFWDGSGSVDASKMWYTGDVTVDISEAKYLFVIFGKSDDSNISPTDVVQNCNLYVDGKLSDVRRELILTKNSVGNEIPFNIIPFYRGTIDDYGALSNISIRVSNAGNPVSVQDSYYVEYNADDGYKIHFSESDGVNAITEKSGFLTGKGLYRLHDLAYLYVIIGKTSDSDINVDEARSHVTFKVITNVEGNAKAIVTPFGVKVPPSIKNYYYGEKISFDNRYNFKKLFTLPNWQNSQGGAIYGDYLVTLIACDENPDAETNGFIYNLKTKTKIADLLFGSTLEGVAYMLPHANCVCFGRQFYSAQSEFPLLYVSQVNGSSGSLFNSSERGCLVYDLQRQPDDSYVPVLVQVIKPDLSTAEKIASIEDKIGKYTPNYVVDADNGRLVILGYPEASWFTGLDKGMPVAVMDLPPVSQEVVTYDADDIFDNYVVSMPFAIQQSIYNCGRIYQQGGLEGNSARGINVIDLVQKKSVSQVITTTAHAGEPQFIGLHDGKLLWYDAGTSGDIYEVVFS